jgi:hypothetical protein
MVLRPLVQCTHKVTEVPYRDHIVSRYKESVSMGYECSLASPFAGLPLAYTENHRYVIPYRLRGLLTDTDSCERQIVKAERIVFCHRPVPLGDPSSHVQDIPYDRMAWWKCPPDQNITYVSCLARHRPCLPHYMELYTDRLVCLFESCRYLVTTFEPGAIYRCFARHLSPRPYRRKDCDLSWKHLLHISMFTSQISIS